MCIGLCSVHPVSYIKECNVTERLFSLYVNLVNEDLTIRYSY